MVKCAARCHGAGRLVPIGSRIASGSPLRGVVAGALPLCHLGVV
jgi:hypothetical protein